MPKPPRRAHVLIERNVVVAQKLRAEPGTWWLVGYGDKDRAKVMAQTAFRINQGDLRAFAADDAGFFEAVATADQSRPGALAPVEAYARYVLK
jgi:hypothetical protein